MRHFPVFLDLRGRRVIVSGAGETAVAKLRLLLKTEAAIAVFGADPAEEIVAWARAGRLVLTPRPLAAGDAAGAVLVYGANAEAAEDGRAAAIGREAGAMVNIVDDLEGSDFITPAIVDRDPVTVAIGTEGAAPVLARGIKARIERMLPTALGPLARIGQAFRGRVEALDSGARRRFWSRFYFETGPRALGEGPQAAAVELDRLLAEGVESGRGVVHLVGAGPGDAELLTLKARRLLHDADVVIHDRLVDPSILELARREARIVAVGKIPYGPSWTQAEINALLVREAGAGQVVVRLKGGDPAIFGRLDEETAALDAAGLPWTVVPGVTAASAAAAALGRSLTRRGRNSSLRLLTAHDAAGFADQDWRALARPGSTAAVYMGVKASAFLRGRLLMHGAAPETPVTAVENAGRLGERVVETMLIDLPQALSAMSPSGPVLLVYGISARRDDADRSNAREAL